MTTTEKFLFLHSATPYTHTHTHLLSLSRKQRLKVACNNKLRITIRVACRVCLLVYSHAFLSSLFSCPCCPRQLSTTNPTSGHIFFSTCSVHSSFQLVYRHPYVPESVIVPSNIFHSWCRWGQLKLIRIPLIRCSNEVENWWETEWEWEWGEFDSKWGVLAVVVMAQ